MKYTGIVTLNIDGKEYVAHNSGSDYLYQIILKYLLYGDYENGIQQKRDGFLKYFDIGYYVGDVFHTIMFDDAPIKTQASRIEGKSIILNGEAIGSNLIIPTGSEYNDKQFVIRVKDESRNYLAQVEMQGNMLTYF